MTGFKRFSCFIRTNLIYPAAISFIAVVVTGVVFFATNSAIVWMACASFAAMTATAVWLFLYMVSLTGEKIIQKRAEAQRKENGYEENE